MSLRRLLDRVVAVAWWRALAALGLVTPEVKPRKTKP